MKTIYITVDTECHDFDKVNQYVYGIKGKEEYGLKKILEIGKTMNVPINVFFDVSECRRYGDDYAKRVVKMIHSYNLPVYFHFHPNYVSDDDSRTFLWEYTIEEQRSLISEALKDYNRLCGIGDRIVFRAGRYGVDENTYRVLSELNISVLDLSFCYNKTKMCHINSEIIGTQNRLTRYMDITIKPNTSYVGFDLLGIQKSILLGIEDTTRNEYRRILRNSKLSSLIYTMHSWDFIKKWFFAPNFIVGNRAEINTFIFHIDYAKKNGFTFGNINDLSNEMVEFDECLNLCKTPVEKMVSLANNFVRFRKMSRINKKYFVFYRIIDIIFVLIFGAFILYL